MRCSDSEENPDFERTFDQTKGYVISKKNSYQNTKTETYRKASINSSGIYSRLCPTQFNNNNVDFQRVLGHKKKMNESSTS